MTAQDIQELLLREEMDKAGLIEMISGIHNKSEDSSMLLFIPKSIKNAYAQPNMGILQMKGIQTLWNIVVSENRRNIPFRGRNIVARLLGKVIFVANLSSNVFVSKGQHTIGLCQVLWEFLVDYDSCLACILLNHNLFL